MLCKYKGNGDKEFAPAYFNSAIKTVTNFEYNLDRSFQEISYRIDNWINKGSGWIIESAEAQYINISVYSPLSGSTYIELPHKLKHPMKGLINVKNNGNKYFLWCHIRYLNPLKIHPERITKVDKKMIKDLDYEGVKSPVSKRVYSKIEKKKNICISVFSYENDLTYPVYVSDQKFKMCVEFSLRPNENESHYVYIKDIKRLMYNKKKTKVKNVFFKCCLQCFSSEKILIKHKENCSIINGK